MNKDKKASIDRRQFLKVLGGSAAVTTAFLAGCKPEDVANVTESSSQLGEVPTDKMTYRTDKHGQKVSILGYGMMRLPTHTAESARESGSEIDQEMVNRQVDYAIEHGINYFDTSPNYCRGKSEQATGIALSRHKRSEFLVATKMSNFHPGQWSREESIKIYNKSFESLQVDTIDYMLLHAIGQGSQDLNKNMLNGMEAFNARFIDNGILDFLVSERAAGRIRNLGFSYHGDVEVFDYLMANHDKYDWDFVQIQMNYVDWKHAKQVNPRNTDAEYLYNELDKRGIPVVIMEPLLGGRLASLNNHSMEQLKQSDPNASVASWAFRFAGHYPRVMTVLSGMTYMEHLQDNIRTYAPLQLLSDEELALLEEIATTYVNFPLVPCTTCQYCMPCPYGLDIPSIFAHYNRCLNEGYILDDVQNEDYRRLRKIFLVGYDRSVPKLRQANHCIGCNQCVSHCPQRINIPKEMHRIDGFVEKLKLSDDFHF